MRQHLADALEFLADFHTLSKLKVCDNNCWTINICAQGTLYVCCGPCSWVDLIWIPVAVHLS
jgi:hypothetical protein